METKNKKDTIIELLKQDLSNDIIALRADCDVSYVKSVEKQIKASASKTIEKLKIKAESGAFGKARMPSITSISEMLTVFGVKHEYDDDVINVVEYRSAGRNYVNSRHDGKKGKKLIINPTKEESELTKIHYIELDSSDSYYSWNTNDYARKLVQYLTALGKI